MADRASLEAGAAETLLPRVEPGLRVYQGGGVYPMDVEPYVRAGGLWIRHPGEEAVCVVPAGELRLDNLAQQPEDSAATIHYLKIPPPEEGEKRGFWARLFRRRCRDGPDWPRET